jgi:hypothetical protein
VDLLVDLYNCKKNAVLIICKCEDSLLIGNLEMSSLEMGSNHIFGSKIKELFFIDLLKFMI